MFYHLLTNIFLAATLIAITKHCCQNLNCLLAKLSSEIFINKNNAWQFTTTTLGTVAHLYFIITGSVYQKMYSLNFTASTNCHVKF
jgi:hypothetical protein